LKIDPKNEDALLDKGIALVYVDSPEKSIEIYDKILEVNPNNYKAHYRKGNAQTKLMMFDNALASFNRSLELNNKDPRVWGDKGALLENMDKLEEALRCYDQALELSQDNLRILHKKGDALFKMNQMSEAISTFDRALKIKSNDIYALKMKGKALMGSDEYERAIQCFEMLIELLPNEVEPWIHKAESLMNIGRLEDAISAYDKAINLDSNNKSLWVSRGLLYDKLKIYREAIESFDNAIKLDNKDAELWYKHGSALHKIGDFESAINSYDKALGIESHNKIFWTSKGEALNGLKRFDQALRCFEHALNFDPKYEPAINGKDFAVNETKRNDIERYAREILVYEKQTQRPITREEAFKNCNIPYTFLDEVIKYLSQGEDVNVEALSPEEKSFFEKASHNIITTTINENPEYFETYGLRLGDIISRFPEYDIQTAKRLLGYIHKVTSMKFAPKAVDPALEEDLHRALEIPQRDRTLVNLMQALRIGIYRAKVISSLLETFHNQEVLTPSVIMQPINELYIPSEDFLGGGVKSESMVGMEGRREVDVGGAHPEPQPDYISSSETSDVELMEGTCPICRERPADFSHRCGAKLCNECLQEYNDKYAQMYDVDGSETICPQCGETVITRERRTTLKKDKGKDSYVRL
jgi:tetratricopeptide (TPR) repeat protein